ncbi:hypothetical protein [Paenibacillus dakarensis]|uniref:hypothetical protein n=1 Tax=Paenibacillus dakarensis TaxID=1527293 RepID=UPI0006D55548|nr:hypothetical protein [Paenibacillus dakarensis]
MYNTTVVTGKIIEIRDDHVVTYEGDAISTYHMGYYLMANEERLPYEEYEMKTETETETETARFNGLFRREWKPVISMLALWRKRERHA